MNISELTYGELLEVLVDDEKCTSCYTCKVDDLQEDDGSKIRCSDARYRLFEELANRHSSWLGEENGNKIRKALEDYEQKTSSQESSIERKPSTESFYEQTVDFMKRSGYTRCYMCGSEL